jgi:uncharacterized protein (UPF0332 family)
MAKATQAIASARALYDLGDADGSCNRAYYAMFDSVRAVLLATGSEVLSVKTHRGVHARFHDRFVRSGRVSEEVGRFLRRAEALRYDADYSGETVSLEITREMVSQAEIFVAAMIHLVGEQPQP